jgi:hypothetical protein
MQLTSLSQHRPLPESPLTNQPPHPVPVQLLVDCPALMPNRPGSHAEHAEDPTALHCPAGHWVTVEVVEPAGHVNPALQSPVQAIVVRPVVDPNLPATTPQRAEDECKDDRSVVLTHKNNTLFFSTHKG